ncbi:MAG: cell division protein FtsZ, partial [Spirochaetales bacterium]|nr:cell division protein FtsZ [Spirochaetales bacterium]
LEDARIDGAKSILINITGGESFTLNEYEEIVGIITQSADPEALVIAGIVNDASAQDEVSVTVIATGFDRSIKPKAQSVAVRKDVSREIDDFLSPDEWRNIVEPRTKGYLMGRNETDELDIPTVLRERRTIAERSGV